MNAYLHTNLTGEILGSADAVHKALGPGFLEAIYEGALCFELSTRGIPFTQQAPLKVHYGGQQVGLYRADLLIDGKVLVEVKAIEAIETIHLKVALAYLSAASLHVALILNFAETILKSRKVFRPYDMMK